MRKKLAEGIDRTGKVYLERSDISLKECTITYNATTNTRYKPLPITLNNKWNNATQSDITETFNPAYIADIQDDASAGSMVLGRIVVKFSGRTAHFREVISAYVERDMPYPYSYGIYSVSNLKEKSSVNESRSSITLYYLKSDTTNLTKIKKALEHLRDSCKAEDDPFGD